MAVKVEKTRSKKGRIILTVIIAVFVLLLGAIGISLTDSLGIKLDEDIKYIEISDGDNAAKIAAELKNNGIIKYPLMFRLQAIAGGYAGHFQPGSAYIENGMSYADILDMLITPSRNTTKVIVPPGCEIREIAIKLCELGLTTWDEFYDALYHVSDYSYGFLEGIPSRDSMLEGYLFPATYEIPNGMSAHDIVDLMLKTFDAQFKPEYYDKAAALGMTVDEVITMASILERETNESCDLKKVAGVLHNKRNSGMYFDANSTVQYVLGERKPVLAIADTKIDSPYNTYVYAGLPIGPIGSPSIAAIEAVLDYSASDAFYFGLSVNGEQIFGTSYDEFVGLVNSTDMAVAVDSDVIKNQDDKIGQMVVEQPEQESTESEE